MQFHASVTPFLGNLDQTLQKSLTDSSFPMLRQNEQIFEKEPWFTDKRRVIPKIKSKANAHRLPFCQQHFNARIGIRKCLPKVIGAGNHFLFKFLVAGESKNQLEDRFGVIRRCKSE